MNLRKWMGVVMGIGTPAVALAHPGHATTDLTTQVALPFAGIDHFLAFMAVTAFLLTALTIAQRARNFRQQKACKTADDQD